MLKATELCIVFEPINGTFEGFGTVLREPLRLGRVGGFAPGTPGVKEFASKVVSRDHAEIYERDGKVYVCDTGSKTGTFLNERQLSRDLAYELNNGDMLRLGANLSDTANASRLDSTSS